MTLSDGLNGIISFIKKGFEGRDEDLWEDFEKDIQKNTLQTVMLHWM